MACAERRWTKSLPRKGLAESWPKKCINSCKDIDLSVDLKLARFPARSPLPIAALPSMSLDPISSIETRSLPSSLAAPHRAFASYVACAHQLHSPIHADSIRLR